MDTVLCCKCLVGCSLWKDGAEGGLVVIGYFDINRGVIGHLFHV